MSTSDIAVESTPWQWSMRDLLLWMSFLAIFSAMVGYMGLDNQLFWTCSVYAVILTIVFTLFVPRQINSVPAIVIGLGLFLMVNPMFMFLSMVTLFNCILHTFVLLFYRAIGAPPDGMPISAKRVAEFSISMTLISLALGIAMSIPRYSDLLRARIEFAPEDLTPRLAYETRPEAPERFHLPEDEFKNSRWHRFETDLQSVMENEHEISGRQWNLEFLHSRQVEKFAKSQGFGVGRFMFGIATPDRARLPEISDISFNGPVNMTEDARPMYRFLSVGSADGFSERHFAGVYDFLSPQTYGLVLEPKIVRGFQSHAFHFRPELSSNGDIMFGYRLKSLQLISLTRFDTPRAYVLDHLPRMDQLSSEDVPTRALTEFESESLKLIENNQDTVIERQEDSVEMVGAIRAVQTCLQCHSAERGDLLGAFSYQFTVKSDSADLERLFPGAKQSDEER